MHQKPKNKELKIVLVTLSKVFYNSISRMVKEYFGITLVYFDKFTKEISKNILVEEPLIILVDVEGDEEEKISFVYYLKRNLPESNIIIFSFLTDYNSKCISECIESGLYSYIEKPSNSSNIDLFKQAFIKKVDLICRKNTSIYDGNISKDLGDVESNSKDLPEEKTYINKPMALAIGCSTGGLSALSEIFKSLGNKVTNIPIFITQHMPSEFVTTLVNTISQISGAVCKEAEHKEKVYPGVIYIAKGDYHMRFILQGRDIYIDLVQTEKENFCRPAVDPMLDSLADIYGGNLLVAILTGIGKDSVKGCQKIFNRGGYIIIQDESTSIVWGMPGSVFKEGSYNKVLPINEIGSTILKICKL